MTLRSRSELIEMEREIRESIGGARDAFELAEKNQYPCLEEAREWLAAFEEELRVFMQFKDKTRGFIDGALGENEKIFFPDFAEVLSCQTGKQLAAPLDSKERMEGVISPAFAYDDVGKPKLPKSANEARRRAFVLWHAKFIMEWLLKRT